jgi:hypothetical protein
VVIDSTGTVFMDCEIRSRENDLALVEVDGSGATLAVGSDRLLSGSVHHGGSATVRLAK